MDAIHTIKLIKTIKKYTENCALLMTTRDSRLAEHLACRIAIMDKGTFLAVGTLGEIIETHGKGFTLDVHCDLNQLQQQQAPDLEPNESLFITSTAQATKLLERIAA